MQEMQGVRKLPQPKALDERRREKLRDQRRVGSQRASDELAQRLLAETRRRRIDGREAIGQRRLSFDDLELRMDDLEAEVTVADVTEHANALSGGERFLLVRVEMEEAQHQLRARATLVVLEQANELPPRPILDLGIDDPSLGLLQRAARERRQWNQARVVLVAQRQVQDEILIAKKPEAHELLGESARRGPGGGRRLRGGGRRRRYQIGSGALAARDVIPRVPERLRLRASRPWAGRRPGRSLAQGTAA